MEGRVLPGATRERKASLEPGGGRGAGGWTFERAALGHALSVAHAHP
jgi:hypothetical protein